MIAKPTVEIPNDAEGLRRAGAEAFARLAAEAVAARGVFTVALSGGTTPKGTYELLASDRAYRDRIAWDRIRFFFGDERHVPPDHAESNYRMAYCALFQPAGVPPWNTHRWATEVADDIPLILGHYESLLKRYLDPKEGEMPRFDLVLLGMGRDGHTASLFPGSDALRETRAVAMPWVGALNARRCTLTPPAFNNAANVIFLVSGADKAETLREVLEGPSRPERLPAQIVRPANGSLTWLVDKPAARLLSGAH